MARVTLSTHFEKVVGFWDRQEGRVVEAQFLSWRKTEAGWYVILRLSGQDLAVSSRGGPVIASPGDVIGINGSHALECLRDLPIGTKVWIEFLGKKEGSEHGRSYLEFKVEADVK